MNVQTSFIAYLTLLWMTTVAFAGSSSDKVAYLYLEADDVVVAICNHREQGHDKSCNDPQEIRRASLQQFANHLWLIMLSDRIAFSTDVKDDVVLYRIHGSLKNLEILNRRQARLRKEADATNTPESKRKLRAVGGLLRDYNKAVRAIRRLDRKLKSLVQSTSRYTSDDPKRIHVGNMDRPSFENLLLNSYVDDITVPLVFIPIRVETFRVDLPNEKTQEIPLTEDIWVTATEITMEHLRELAIPDSILNLDPSETGGCKDLASMGLNHPVLDISWIRINTIVNYLNEKQPYFKFHLPTEAQWEYIARVESNRAYHFGDDGEYLESHPWSADKPTGRLSTTHVVAGLLPNTFGVFDIYGNLAEWCYNEYEGKSFSLPIENPEPFFESEGGGMRIMRGHSRIDESEGQTRSDDLLPARFDMCWSDYGFRLVFTPI